MRLSIREEIMYQRKAYELSEMIIDTVCAELEEEQNVQEMLDEIENYNSSIRAEHVSEDTLEVPEAVKTITVSENENDKIVSDMLDHLERELEDRDGPATERREQSARLKIDDDEIKASCFGAARAKFNETHKLRPILGDEKIIKKEKCVEAEKIEDNIIDGGYCCLFGGFGGYEEVDFSLKKLNHFTTEDSESRVKPDPLKKFYDLFNYIYNVRPVDRDHKNNQHTKNDKKNDDNLNGNDHTTMAKATNITSTNRPTTVEMATTTGETATSTSTSKPTTKMTDSVNPEINCLPIPVYVIYGSLVISSISILVLIVIVILCVIKKRTRTQKDDTYQTMGDRSIESMHYYDHVSHRPELPIPTKKKRKTTLFDRLLYVFRKNLQFEIVNEYEDVRFSNKPAAVSSIPPELPKKREVNVNLIGESNEDNYLEPVVTPNLRNKYKMRVGKQPITKAQKTLNMPSCGSDSTAVQATVEARAFKGRNCLSESSSIKPKKNAEVGTHLLTRTISLPRKNSEIVI